jgi:uncharacterized protein
MIHLKRIVLLAPLMVGAGLFLCARQGVGAEIQAPGPDGPLRGTLLSPGPGTPAHLVLIIPGSGPTDRNGNGAGGLRANTYRLLAQGLLENEIASVRIDKRGLFGSAAAVPDANAVTIDDYAADIATWVRTVRQKTGVQCVWLAGHSEGGLVALVAMQKPDGICGAILLATPGRPLSMILRQQIAAVPGLADVSNQANTILDELDAGTAVPAGAIPPKLLPLFRPEVQGLLISEMRLDPGKLIADVNKPVLILQGRKDLEINAVDASVLKQNSRLGTLVWLENANHFLKDVGPVDYSDDWKVDSDSSIPLDPSVITTISSFIKAADKH